MIEILNGHFLWSSKVKTVGIKIDIDREVDFYCASKTNFQEDYK
jgi:hypothetical protein